MPAALGVASVNHAHAQDQQAAGHAIAYAPGTTASDLACVCGVSGTLPAGAAYAGPAVWAGPKIVSFNRVEVGMKTTAPAKAS